MKKNVLCLATLILAGCASHEPKMTACGWTLPPGATLVHPDSNHVDFARPVALGLIADAYNACQRKPTLLVDAAIAQTRYVGVLQFDMSPAAFATVLSFDPGVKVREAGDVIEISRATP